MREIIAVLFVVLLLCLVSYATGKLAVKRSLQKYINEQRYNRYIGIYGHQIPDYLTKIEELLKDI